ISARVAIGIAAAMRPSRPALLHEGDAGDLGGGTLRRGWRMPVLIVAMLIAAMMLVAARLLMLLAGLAATRLLAVRPLAVLALRLAAVAAIRIARIAVAPVAVAAAGVVRPVMLGRRSRRMRRGALVGHR